MVPLFLTIRIYLYQFCINPSNLTRTKLQLSYTAEKPLLKVGREAVSWIQIPATLLQTGQS